METGMIFDIKELAIHDGPGIRTTVFMKGCPLRCRWCHNPEGLEQTVQQVRSGGDTRTVGRRYTSDELADLLNSQVEIFRASCGGVTFSGGEPLMQAAFLAEVIDKLDKTHILLDTSGFGSAENFALILPKVDHVYFDVKLIDDTEHRRWTGVSNGPILRNLHTMDEHAVPYTLRLPLVPGITDTEVNLEQIAYTVQKLQNASELHVLPYNSLAGGKYEPYGMTYTLSDEPCTQESIDQAMEILGRLDIEVVLK